MAQTKVSSKYQVVIPKEVRDEIAIEPGQIFTVFVRGDVIMLVPRIPLERLRGFARGMRIDNVRDKTDRF